MDKRAAWLGLAALAACANQERPGDLASVDEESVICAGATTLEGIDVSYYQGSIDWGAVKRSGRAFAVARISDGSYQDVNFAANWSGMKAAGLVRGAYEFFRPGQDALAQADNVVAKVGVLGDGDLPVTLDVEATDGQSAATIAAKIHTWMTRVTAGTGRTPIIYTGKYFWNDNVVSADFAGNPLWIAAYGPPCPDTPTAWGARPWKIWQYSSSGSVPGISGNVDLDHFNGTLTDLQDLSGGADWGAKYVGQSFPLATTALRITAGDTVDAWIELRNVGRKAWDTRTRLGTTGPRDRASAFADASWIGANRPDGVTGSVAPGATFRFQFKLHAPGAARDLPRALRRGRGGRGLVQRPGPGRSGRRSAGGAARGGRGAACRRHHRAARSDAGQGGAAGHGRVRRLERAARGDGARCERGRLPGCRQLARGWGVARGAHGARPGARPPAMPAPALTHSVR